MTEQNRLAWLTQAFINNRQIDVVVFTSIGWWDQARTLEAFVIAYWCEGHLTVGLWTYNGESFDRVKSV